jgi:hypothetical protein
MESASVLVLILMGAFRSPLNLTLDVPSCLLQIFNSIVFQICTPNVLNGIAQAKIHVFSDLDAFDAARVRRVMLGVVDFIFHLNFLGWGLSPPVWFIYRSQSFLGILCNCTVLQTT